MVLNEPGLNKTGTKILGIDIASNAISEANDLLNKIINQNRINDIPEYFPVKVDSAEIKSEIEFKCCDILDDSARRQLTEYDLVIDWMCFHELPKANWSDYVKLIEKICANWFILNVFILNDEMEMHGLEPVAQHVPKHQISDGTIRQDLFKNFEYIDSYYYKENLANQSFSTPIAAKRAYLFSKRYVGTQR